MLPTVKFSVRGGRPLVGKHIKILARLVANLHRHRLRVHLVLQILKPLEMSVERLAIVVREFHEVRLAIVSCDIAIAAADRVKIALTFVLVICLPLQSYQGIVFIPAKTPLTLLMLLLSLQRYVTFSPLLAVIGGKNEFIGRVSLHVCSLGLLVVHFLACAVYFHFLGN